MEFYTSVFKNSKVNVINRYGKSGPGPEGSVMTVAFELDGQQFIGLNGGPQFKFNESISFVISCNDQEEIDHYWNKLTEGGEPSRCGWLKDKFGLSWQVVPKKFGEMMNSKDPSKTQRVMEAMMKMDKMDVRKLEDAFEGR